MKVSELSFGASSLGGVFRTIKETEAIESVFNAVDCGINFIDVSPYYSPETERIFVDNINLRHKLLPYITKYGNAVSEEDYTLMRPLLFDFPEDTEALKQDTEFMFGPAILVNPVLETGVSTYRSYLPSYEEGWVDFHTGKKYSGGCYVDTEVSLEYIPVFVKADMYEDLLSMTK